MNSSALRRVISAAVRATACFLIGAAFTSTVAAEDSPETHDLSKLRILKDGYPRTFFFRHAESDAAKTSVKYERWDNSFSRLMGIEGKVLDEEIPGRSKRNIEFFSRFKTEHPDQLVLLHYNGNARDPRNQNGKFFAGHWLYYVGMSIDSDIPAIAGESEIKVKNPKEFHTKIGRNGDSNEDIGLCMLDASGKPDWHQAEQVELLSVDEKKGTIRVKRGAFGTKPMAFPAGKGYAAVHVYEGPWGGNANLLWAYNYSTGCPKDANAKSCADIVIDDIGGLFGAGGALVNFDGLEFDVLGNSIKGSTKRRGIDSNGDGIVDGGVENGIDAYQAGVIDFLSRLHRKLGPNRFLMADGWSIGNQRAFGIMNGVESEGWPSLKDYKVEDWSGGLNRMLFWSRNSAPPSFNYINHKFNAGKEGGGDGHIMKFDEVPRNMNRLVFAGAMFTDSALCFSLVPPADSGPTSGVWDEFCCGADNKLGWLGQPTGPAIHLATKQPDVLAGKGMPVTPDLAARFAGDGVKFEAKEGRLLITATDPKAAEMRFRLKDVESKGPDLFLEMEMTADPMHDAPPPVARTLRLGVKKTADRFMGWANAKPFPTTCYLPDMAKEKTDIQFSLENAEPAAISRIAIRNAPDLMYRAFEHGIVLANPSLHEQSFDVAALAPGRKFRRIKGVASQDAKTNDGSAVTGPLKLGPKDAIFLVGE